MTTDAEKWRQLFLDAAETRDEFADTLFAILENSPHTHDRPEGMAEATWTSAADCAPCLAKETLVCAGQPKGARKNRR